MNFKNLLNEDDAVSPVIGVILMVAITVILAAVIGTFVLGLGDQVSNTSPSASFTFDFDSSSSPSVCTGYGSDGELTITHDGGDSISADLLTITDGGTTNNWYTCDSSTSAASDVNAGDQAVAEVANDDTVRIVWESSNGGDTATLGKWDGPEA